MHVPDTQQTLNTIFKIIFNCNLSEFLIVNGQEMSRKFPRSAAFLFTITVVSCSAEA